MSRGSLRIATCPLPTPPSSPLLEGGAYVLRFACQKGPTRGEALISRACLTELIYGGTAHVRGCRGFTRLMRGRPCIPQPVWRNYNGDTAERPASINGWWSWGVVKVATGWWTRHNIIRILMSDCGGEGVKLQTTPRP